MKPSEQLDLVQSCQTWFDHKFPELDGLLLPISKPNTLKMQMFGRTFVSKSDHLRLIFIFHDRVWIFVPFHHWKHDPKASRGSVLSDNSEVRYIADLDEFVKHIRTILAYYQHENLGL